MANLVLRPFVPEDYTRLTHEPVCPVSGGPAFTGLLDGEIAGCAGVTLASYGAWGTAWARLGPLGRRHGLAASRAVRRGLATIIRDYGLIRVEADVLAHYDAARRWVMWLGFTEEGLMRKRGPEGADMIRYVLFPKEDPGSSIQVLPGALGAGAVFQRATRAHPLAQPAVSLP